jgi:hypothetical protein
MLLVTTKHNKLGHPGANRLRDYEQQNRRAKKRSASCGQLCPIEAKSDLSEIPKMESRRIANLSAFPLSRQSVGLTNRNPHSVFVARGGPRCNPGAAAIPK